LFFFNKHSAYSSFSMNRDRTGTYHTTSTTGEHVRAFVPLALPPFPILEITGARQLLLEQATLAVGRLDSLTMLLPDPHLFLYSYVRREAVLSSQIEGTQSSLSDLLLFELEAVPGTPFDDVVEVSNYIAALERGVARLQEGFPLSNRVLREMHGALMSRGRGSDKLPGEFRRTQNWIGGSRPGNARFVPPPPQEVEPCMAALERFLHEDSTGLPVLLKAALAHVQFETIHPFLDGNGRVGRLLIALVLHHGGLLSQPLLYLSLYLKEHRQMYYDLLDRVRMTGDWEAWVDFFLEGVEETARGAVQTARRLIELFEADNRRVQQGGRGAANALRVLAALRERPVLTLNYLRDTHSMTFPTAGKAMHSLARMGIARELTGQRRNRVFVYDAYLTILNEGGEPL
jgi:Fic family protein